MKKIFLLAFIPLSLLANPQKQRVGLQGFVQIDGAYIYRKSSKYTSIPFTEASNKRIESLKDSHNEYSAILPIPRFNTLYKFEDKSGFSIGNKHLADFAITYFTPTKIGFFQFGYVPGFGNEWENPYEVQKDRVATNIEKHGLFSQWKTKEYGIKLFYKTVKLSSDTTTTLGDLGRTGKEAGVEISKSFGFNNLKVQHSKFSAQGGADSYVDNKLSYTLVLPSKSRTLITNISYGMKDFQKSHPVFDKIRKDTGYALALIGQFREVFETQGRYLSLSAIIGRSNSNIDFFNEDMHVVSIGIGQRF